MYDDQWYSFVPEVNNKAPSDPKSVRGHGRKPSLLQQPNADGDTRNSSELSRPVLSSIEDEGDDFPEPEVLRRASSISDLKKSRQTSLTVKFACRTTSTSRVPALDLDSYSASGDDITDESEDEEILQGKSRSTYTAYRSQLTLTEGHLESLIADTDTTLALLDKLTTSFQSVEQQTTSFRSQCEDLIADQERLKKLADEVGTDLHYYGYIDSATRRLNAPGASRLVEDSTFADIFRHLDSCIDFMAKHPTYREADNYLARYQSLLTKALHLLETALTAKLEKVASNLSPQLAATTSESAQHALSYDRFAELLLDSYSLVPNIHEVTTRVYTSTGIHKEPASTSETSATSHPWQPIYHNSAKNLFYSYLSIRDQHIRALALRDTEEYKRAQAAASTPAALETASRTYIQQCFERAFNEVNLFAKVFGFLPRRSPDADSAYAVLASYSRLLVNPANLAPPGAAIQAGLQSAELRTVCNIVGWLSNEFLLVDYDEEGSEAPFAVFGREYAAALLQEHLWPFVERGFEAEVAKVVTRVPADTGPVVIPKVVGPVVSANAAPVVKVSGALLNMFDQCMPKDRSRQSRVIFTIVRETIKALQRSEAKAKATSGSSDPDLFLLKNLLVFRNQLVTLEFGDLAQDTSTASGGALGPIWDSLNPQAWLGLFNSIMSVAPLPTIPLWSRMPSISGNSAPAAAATPGLPPLTRGTMGEHLDELLRRAIYGFTGRWAAKMVEARRMGEKGEKELAKIDVELEDLLEGVFGNQGEVVERLKEAIEMNVTMQMEQKGKK